MGPIKLDKTLASQASFVWRGLSLRSLKLIFVGIIACFFSFFLFLWLPAYDEFCSLNEDKLYWRQVTSMGVKTSATNIPSMDQLPNLIDRCCGVFVKEGVNVVSFNVERFGERSEMNKGTRIDYALVRLRLLGQWRGILNSLEELENTQGLSIRVQEVLLGEEGGNTLLKVYFKTGNE